MNQSEFEANACNRRQTRKNACKPVMIGFGWKSGTSLVNQSQSERKQNQSKYQITFDTRLKTPLFPHRN